MYRILVDTADPNKPVCLFDDRLIDQRVKVVDPVLELEDNASGSLEFTIYSTNQGYGTPDGETDDLLIVSSSTLRVYQEAEEIWEGRPLTIGTDFWNGKTVTCEGALSYLNDIDQPYKEYANPNGGKLEIETFIKGVLTAYNDRASDNRKFYVDGTYVNPIKIPTGYNLKGDVASYSSLPSSDVSDMDLYRTEDTDQYWLWYDSKWNDVTENIHLTLGYRRSTGGESTKDAIFALVDDEQFGGHIKVVTDSQKRRCLYYTLAIDPEEEFIRGSATLPVQDVTFGKNLLDLTKTRDSSDFFTVLLPVGAEISPSHPETIETMCLDLMNYIPTDGSKTPFQGITDTGNDVEISTRTTLFDASHVYTDVQTGYARRRTSIDLDSHAGYDVFLYTSNYYRTDEQGSANLGTYLVLDRSAEDSKIVDMHNPTAQDPGGLGYGAVDHTGTTIQGGDYGSTTYKNNRIVASKALSKTQYSRQILDGERISVSDVGVTSITFATASDYCWYSSKSNPSVRGRIPESWETPITPEWRAANKIEYPKLYRMPYKRSEYEQSSVRKVSDDDILWVGVNPDGTVYGCRDLHWLSDINTEPYISYGADDCDMIPIGGYGAGGDDGTLRLTVSGDKSAHFLDRFPPFGTDYHPTANYPGHSTIDSIPWEWKNGNSYDLNKRFLTGFFGHHVARVMVEPGKTYYLNTRVTNVGYPDVTEYNTYYAGSDYEWAYGYQDCGWTYVPEDKWPFDWSAVPKKRTYNDIFAYAVVARRPIRSKASQNLVWSYEVLSYKLANKSNVTTELAMEKIVIPEAVFPERKASFSEPNYDEIQHLEIWFTCDSCYLNGNANLGNASDNPNPLNSYQPSVYIEDVSNTPDESSNGTDYHKCVTIAPINEQPEGYSRFPKEYLVNKTLADRYGVIVRQVEFPEAYTPSALLMNAQRVMNLMTGVPSFEASVIDLKECGLEDVDHLRLLQKIKIDSDPHGINSKVALSQMSINLADRTSNTYTFGYEANKGISQM